MPYRCLAVLAIMATAGTASAQPLEAGGSLATSCRGSDGSFCESESLGTIGAYAGFWFADRIEVGARLAWLGFDDQAGFTSVDPPRVDFQITDASRMVVQAEGIWHFRRGHRVRPMFGVGLGFF